MAGEVAAWAEERCRRTMEWSTSLDLLLRDYQRWSGTQCVDRAAFTGALGGLGVRVFGGAVALGVVLR